VSFTAIAPRIPPVAMSAAASIQRIERINDPAAHAAVSGSVTSSRRNIFDRRFVWLMRQIAA